MNKQESKTLECIYVCVHAFMCVCVYVHACMCVCVCVCMHVCVYFQARWLVQSRNLLESADF